MRRNSKEGLYLPDTADTLAQKRRWRGCKIERDVELRDYITDKVAMARWSPGRIPGRMKADNLAFHACAETIYRFIYSPAAKQYNLIGHLFKAKPKRSGVRGRKTRKTPIPNRIPIALRPEAVNNRSEFGHWEGDLVLYQAGGNLLTMQERNPVLPSSLKTPPNTKKEPNR